MRIPLTEREFRLLINRKVASDSATNGAQVAQLMAQQQSEAYAATIACFAPEKANIGALDNVKPGQDEQGYFMAIPDQLPLAETGGAPPVDQPNPPAAPPADKPPSQTTDVADSVATS